MAWVGIKVFRFFSSLRIAVCGVAALPAVRWPTVRWPAMRWPAMRWPAMRRAAAPAIVPAAGSPETASAPPIDLSHLPEPPVLQAADSVQFLDCAEVLRKLRGLELGAELPADAGGQDPEHDRIVAAALTAIGDPASQKKYFPRRPNLLPELIRAINDEGVSVRQVVPIVARDPALVGNLLKVANSSYYRVTQQPIETI